MADELNKGTPESKNPEVPGVHPDHDPAYPDYTAFPGLPKHFSVVSAQKAGVDHDETAHRSMAEDLKAAGLEAISVKGYSGHAEENYLIAHAGSAKDQKAAEDIAWKYNQHSVIHHDNEKTRLTFRDKSPDWEGKGVVHGPHIKDHYLQLPTGHRVQFNIKSPDVKKSDAFDLLNHQKKKRDKHSGAPHHYGLIAGINVFHATHECHDQLPGLHLHSPDDKKLEEALDQAEEKKEPSIIIHGNAPAMLRENAPGADHPHAYDWHDKAPAGDVGKSEARPHAPSAQPVAEPHHGNANQVGHGSSVYRPIAEHYGQLMSDHTPNLHFYRGIEESESKIDDLIHQNGYQLYFAGGSHGKPDPTKHYSTKDLMLWDDENPDPYSRCWRKLHELAHGLTFDEINDLYGEGNRVGKLGERTPREAKRSVHWEWLAAHKQKELTEKLGHPILDEDFSRELNTLMHDSVHRAISGQYSQPSDEGFVPFSEEVALEEALKLIEEHAKKAGLEHEEANFASTGVPRDVLQNYQTVSKAEGASGPLNQGGKIRRFHMQREQDASGISGTGRVAEGVIFSNGWVGMSWLTRWGSLAFYPSIEDVEQVHGHQGKTKIIYEDIPEGTKEEPIVVADKKSEPKSGDIIEIPTEKKKEDLAPGDTREKWKKLQDKLVAFYRDQAKEHQETLSGKELAKGIENPEKDCGACEREVDQCVCYLNLPRPRIELTAKGVNIFFKSEWQAEDIANFKEDLTRRAGTILQQRRLQKAKEAITRIRKKNDV